MELPDADEIFYIGAAFSPSTPTIPAITRKKKKRQKHEKFKHVIKQKVTAMTEKLKRRRCYNIDASTTTEGRRPNGWRPTAID